MALFFSTTKKAAKKTAKVTKPVAAKTSEHSSDGTLAHILSRPRITEKAALMQGASVYTFNISADATKPQIAAIVREMYKVTPRKIAVVTVPSKQTRSTRTGKKGMKSGGRKAYIYLKAGETITIA